MSHIVGTLIFSPEGPCAYTAGYELVSSLALDHPMTASGTRIGYARCSTDAQDLAAQRAALHDLGVEEERIHTDHGLSGTNRARPGLDQALAAVRAGDSLLVPKLDRLARYRARCI